MSAIKTPDQRVRVFISSTMQELADERKAVTDAISRLRLIPVLFELGARPHPPRDLYRAYLEQSHVFVGIYWNNYGWVAPGMQISGLEDEYRLSTEKPRLIYVKQHAQNRQPKLQTLLTEIEKSETACYRHFSNAKELSELVENDLALLLSERFETKLPQPASFESKKQNTLPVIRSPLLGREKEMRTLKEMIFQPEVCLITLCGTGGTGKTRLSIQLANEIKSAFKDDVYFIPLASITDSNLVGATIANEIGLFDSGHQPIRNTLIDYLRDKNALLLLDNFEQIVASAPLVADIMEKCPSIKIIATSRTPLHIRGEHVVPVSPLANPDLKKIFIKNDLLNYPSIELFIQRALEVNPELLVNGENLNAIAEICHKLDGLPLAIELAASRTKFLSPVALLKRMGSVLDLLSRGPKDLPERQQTLRATIDWSYNLLDDDSRKFFYRLAVFKEGWTLDASLAVANASGDIQADVVEVTEKLADLGLLKIFSHYNEAQSTVEPRFTMLQTVLEYATEKLAASNELPDVSKAHADYFIQMAEDANLYLWSVRPEPWLDVLEREFQNLRAAFMNCVEAGRISDSWQLFGTVLMLWVTRGRINEGLEWMKTADISAESALLPFNVEQIDPRYRARALLATGCLKVFETDFKNSSIALEQSMRLFDELNDIKNKARALTFSGISGISYGDITAASKLQQAIQLGYETNDVFSIVMASTFGGEVSVIMGDYDKAARLFESARELCMQTGFNAGLAVVMSQMGSLHISRNDFDKAEASYLKAIELYQQTSQVSLKGWAYLGLGYCKVVRDDFNGARENFNNGLECGRETGDNSMVLVSLTGFSALAAAAGECIKTARLLGAAESMLIRISYVSWSVERKMHEWVENKGCEGLGKEIFDQEREIGRTMLPEQAIALALSGEKEEASSRISE